MTVGWLALASAFAQDVEGYDAHGFVLAGNAGGPLDGQVVWRPTSEGEGSWSLRGVFEYAEAPFVLVHDVGLASESVTPVVDDVFAMNAVGRIAIDDGVAATVAFPVFLSTQGVDGTGSPGLGDVRIATPLRAIARTEGGVGVDVVPFATLPTGNPRVFLGNSGLSGGLLVAAGWERDGLSCDGNLGVESAPSIRFANLRGGSRTIASAGFGYAFTDVVGVRGEVILRPALARNTYAWSEAPGEALLSVGGRTASGLTFTVGGASAVTRGVGAAVYRVFAGVGFSMGGGATDVEEVVGPPVEADRDQDGVADLGDMCPTESEVANGFADLDGCPDLLADVRIVVLGPDDKPVAGATVVVGAVEVVTGADGVAAFAGVVPGKLGASVKPANGLLAGTSGELVVGEGPSEATIRVAKAPPPGP